MERGSLCDLSPLFGFARPDGRTLFDFQIAAARFCASRLQQQSCAVLALDTGLGKTCTIRATLDQMGARALVICPGGLVRQTAKGLERFPWDAEPWVVGRVETGKQLAEAARRVQDYRALVVNRSINCYQYIEVFSRNFDVVVADEAHQPQTLSALRGAPKEMPVLYATACPGEANALAELMGSQGRRPGVSSGYQSYSEYCFVVRKTPRVLDLLGVTKPRVSLVHIVSPAEELEAYDETLVKLVRHDIRSAESKLQMLATIAELLPRCGARAALAARDILHEVFTRESYSAPSDETISRARALLDAQGLVVPPGARGDEAGRGRRGAARCGCCNLLVSELGRLYSLHHDSLPSEPLPLWVVAQKTGFTSAIVRFRDKRHIESTLRAHPIPEHMQSFVLTTDKSAAYRARLVRQFASHGGQRAKVLVIKRALKRGKAPEMLLRIGALGMGRFFTDTLERFLARPRLLIADSSVDVGYDLHRHVNAMHIPRLVETRAELLQLTGRVSRIAVDVEDQGDIEVLANCYDGTLDSELFAKHLLRDESGHGAARSSSEDVVARARRLLASDEEALALFEERLRPTA